MTGLRALLVLALTQAGCATVSGQEWLNVPVEQQSELAVTSVDTTPNVVDAPQRLNHTVTLGESYASYPASGAPSAAGAPAVQVNVPVVINNYGGYGYGPAYGATFYGARAVTTPLRSTSTAAKVGADFPAVPDYGPRALR